MRIRMLFAALLGTMIMALAAPATATAWPPGVYFIRCQGGKATMINIIGNTVGTGWCTGGNWTMKVIVQARVVSPPAPTLDPPQDPIWQGLSAKDWVGYVRDGITPGDDGGYVDPAELEGRFPTLTCNEAHFDPEG